MEAYKPIKGISLFYIVLLMVLTNLFFCILIFFLNSYLIISLLRVALAVINIYIFYYFLLSASLIYEVDDFGITIKTFLGLKKIRIAFESIEGYKKHEGSIRGIKLSGIGNDRFAFGRNVIDKIGTTYMFVTSNRKTIYIKTPLITYALSPVELEKFESKLKYMGISNQIGDFKLNKNTDLYKQKEFFIPFILVAVIIVVLTLNPFVLYLKNILPAKMPLNFDATFYPIAYGTGKQFAFKQMTYGVFNMVILLCMYYASYFCAKYDRKSAYKYIYVAMASAITFLIMQLRIILTFR